jgi:hypothetical protein
MFLLVVFEKIVISWSSSSSTCISEPYATGLAAGLLISAIAL